MKRILLGCTLVAFALLLGAQVASAQAGTPGPPINSLVPIPDGYDTSKAEFVKEDDVAFLLTKDFYVRKIYKVSMPPAQPKTKYAVQEYVKVTRPEYVPGWYEVEPATPEPTFEWKYRTHR